jgi:hypothetical protein
VREAFLDAKTYWFIGMALANNLGAQVTNTFGPLILVGFGHDKYATSLLNMPFGALQYAVILGVAWAAERWRRKGVTLAVMLVPILAGLATLYALPRDAGHTGALLAAYYLLAFIFGCNTLIVSWILANTAGATKRSVVMALYQAASSAGNIIGPLLFSADDKPGYYPGLRKTLGVFAMFAALVAVQVATLAALNRRHEKARVAAGKPRWVADRSMERSWRGEGDGDGALGLGSRAFEDLTDGKNDEFIYVY